MASVQAESRYEVDRQEQRGLVLAGLPFELKPGYGSSKFLEYDYEGRPMVVYDHLPVFGAIVRLLEMYRDLERQVSGLTKDRDEAAEKAGMAEARAEKSEAEVQRHKKK